MHKKDQEVKKCVRKQVFLQHAMPNHVYTSKLPYSFLTETNYLNYKDSGISKNTSGNSNTRNKTINNFTGTSGVKIEHYATLNDGRLHLILTN